MQWILCRLSTQYNVKRDVLKCYWNLQFTVNNMVFIELSLFLKAALQSLAWNELQCWLKYNQTGSRMSYNCLALNWQHSKIAQNSNSRNSLLNNSLDNCGKNTSWNLQRVIDRTGIIPRLWKSEFIKWPLSTWPIFDVLTLVTKNWSGNSLLSFDSSFGYANLCQPKIIWVFKIDKGTSNVKIEKERHLD